MDERDVVIEREPSEVNDPRQRSSNALMRRRDLLRSLLVGSGLALSPSLASLARPGVARALAVGTRAPEIGLPIIANGSGSLSIASLRGQVVIVDFWATWCAPCAHEMPVLERLFTQNRGSLTVVGVAQDDDASNVSRFLRRVPVSFPIVHDATRAASGRYAPPNMPTSFFIDRRGIVRQIHAGFRAGDAAQMERDVAALVRQPAR